MSQMLHFQFELDPGTWGLEGENRNRELEILENV